MTSKERIQCVLKGEKPDRYPTYEHFWTETIARWKREGLPEDCDIHGYFDFDIARCGGFGMSVQLETQVLREDENYRTIKDGRGVTLRTHKFESGHTPHWVDAPVKTAEDWYEYRKRLVFNTRRVETDAFEKARELRQKGKFVCLFNSDPYEHAWPVFGQENILVLMLEEPELVRDAIDTWADLTIECFRYYIENGLDFDGYFVSSDLGYRNGTLFSADSYRSLIFPAHKRINDFLHEHGKTVIIHSCGKIESFIPMIIEAGFDVLQPLEVKCGQNVIDIAAKFGKEITYFGNIDVRALSEDRKAIRDEILPKLKAFDGKYNYIFHSDHSIPPTVSFENYCYALELARNYLD